MENRELQKFIILKDYYKEIIDFCISKKLTKPKASISELSFILLAFDLFELLNSIELLFKNKSLIGLESLIRITFERYMYLKLVLSKNKYGEAYYLSMQVSQIEMLNSINEDSENLEAFSKSLGKGKEEFKSEINYRFNKKENKLKHENILKNYKKLFEFDIPENRVFKVKWYNLEKDANELRKLAVKINEIEGYLTIYKLFSNEIHGTTMSSYFKLINIPDETIIGVVEENGLINKNQIVFASSIIFKAINLIEKKYKIPKYMKKRFLSEFDSLIDPNTRLKEIIIKKGI